MMMNQRLLEELIKQNNKLQYENNFLKKRNGTLWYAMAFLLAVVVYCIFTIGFLTAFA